MLKTPPKLRLIIQEIERMREKGVYHKEKNTQPTI